MKGGWSGKRIFEKTIRIILLFMIILHNLIA